MMAVGSFPFTKIVKENFILRETSSEIQGTVLNLHCDSIPCPENEQDDGGTISNQQEETFIRTKFMKNGHLPQPDGGRGAEDRKVV